MLPITLKELSQVTGGELSFGSMPPRDGGLTAVGPITTDSRRVQADMVFWALVGPRFDGNCFAEDALVRGASGVVVAGRNIEPWAGRWALRVDDGQQALWRLAAWQRRNFAGRVVAVTGSVGKTSTRRMIDTVLAARFSGSTSPGNFNNHLGVPLSLLQIEREHDYAALEVAASGPGEIEKLANLCRPEIGVITRIGEAHLGGFGTQAELAKNKTDLIASLPRAGLAVLNGDDPWQRQLAHRTAARVVWTGRDGHNDVVGCDVYASGGRLQFRVERQRYDVPVWGRHQLTSALAAIAVGLEFGLSHAEMAAALGDYSPPTMRCDVSHVGRGTLIDDTYNASPAAMRAALRLLRDVDAPGERVVVCGDMRELGEASQQWHEQLGEEVVTVCGADRLIACGEHAEHVVRAARAAGMPAARTVALKIVEETIPYVSEAVGRGSAVLVKGSRVLGMERVSAAVRGLRHAA